MFSIGGKFLGENHHTLIMAELGQAHDGSLGTAYALVNAIANAGCDAVKFQIHFAEDESTINDKFRTKFSVQDKTRFDYWKRIEFTESQWISLADHAKNKGLIVVCSAFSDRALELTQRLGSDAIKIASGEFFNESLLSLAEESNLPILLSTGMSTLSECDSLVDRFSRKRKKILIMQCTSQYPTSLNQVGVNVLDEFRHRYNIPIGLSDHSGKIFPGLYGIAAGIELLEVHATFNEKMFGPDTSSSLTIKELNELVEARDAIFQMKSNPVDKDKVAHELDMMRSLFTRSVGLKRSMCKGDILIREDLVGKKPGDGIPWEKVEKVVGARLKVAVESNRLLSWTDLENLP